MCSPLAKRKYAQQACTYFLNWVYLQKMSLFIEALKCIEVNMAISKNLVSFIAIKNYAYQ